MIITETQLNKINDLISENKVITEESNNRDERNVKVKVGVASGYYQKLKYHLGCLERRPIFLGTL